MEFEENSMNLDVAEDILVEVNAATEQPVVETSDIERKREQHRISARKRRMKVKQDEKLDAAEKKRNRMAKQFNRKKKKLEDSGLLLTPAIAWKLKAEIEQKEKSKIAKKTKKTPKPKSVPKKKMSVVKKKIDQGSLTNAQCRLCFKNFYSKENRFRLSYADAKIFKKLTGLTLSLKGIYPRNMCTACDQALKNFAMWRQELIREQKKFYATVGFYAEDPERDSFFGYTSPEKEIDIKEEQQKLFVIEENQVIGIKEEKDELAIVTIVTKTEKWENFDEIPIHLPIPEIFSKPDKSTKLNLRPRVKNVKSEKTFKIDKKLNIPVRCPHCSELTKFLAAHLRDMHNLVNLKYICDICNYTTTKHRCMVTHIKREIDRGAGIGKPSVTSPPKANRELCNHCGKFITNIKLHLSAVLKKTTFCCDLCSYTCYRKGAIQSHLERRHIKANAIPCDQCKRTFKFQKDLRKHKENSHAPRIHSCSFCECVYCSENLLKRHIASQHINPIIYTCTICNIIFKTSAQLSSHRNKHLDNRKYKCQECSERFNTLPEFERHGCNKTLRFSCEAPGCSSLLTRIDNYRSHVKKHKDISEKEKEEMLDRAKRIQDAQVKIRYTRDN